MPKIAWAKKLYSAYHSINKNEKVLDSDMNYLGRANGYKARCTATSPGSVQLDNNSWISGDVEKKDDYWILTLNSTIIYTT